MPHVATQIVVLAVVLEHLVPAAAVPGPIVTSLTLKPSSISGGSGATSTGTVTRSAAAPAGGTSVALSSSISALAAVPPSITIAAGQTSATFTVWTNPKYRDYSGLAFSPVITASANGGTQSATLSVSAQPPPADIQNDTADRHGDVCGGSFPATFGEKGILFTCFAGPTPGTAGTACSNRSAWSPAASPSRPMVASSSATSAAPARPIRSASIRRWCWARAARPAR